MAIESVTIRLVASLYVTSSTHPDSPQAMLDTASAQFQHKIDRLLSTFTRRTFWMPSLLARPFRAVQSPSSNTASDSCSISRDLFSIDTGPPGYKVCSKKDRTFAIKTLLLILQHFKHCPPQSSPLYWQYTVPNVSSIFSMPPGTHLM